MASQVSVRAYQAPKTLPEMPKGVIQLGKKRSDGGFDRVGVHQPLLAKQPKAADAKKDHHVHIDLDSPDISPAKPTVVELNLHHDHNPEVHVVDAEE